MTRTGTVTSSRVTSHESRSLVTVVTSLVTVTVTVTVACWYDLSPWPRRRPGPARGRRTWTRASLSRRGVFRSVAVLVTSIGMTRARIPPGRTPGPGPAADGPHPRGPGLANAGGQGQLRRPGRRGQTMPVPGRAGFKVSGDYK